MPANMPKTPTISAVDIFCGIGGLTHGLLQSGIKVRAGIDNDDSCRYAYEKNNPGSIFLERDIRDIHFSDIQKYYSGADIFALVGCAPCQPFSAHNRKHQPAIPEDCSPVDEFSRLVEEGKPDIISIENVPGLIKHEAFQRFVSLLKNLNYAVSHDVIACREYGIPQTRQRLVLLASRRDVLPAPKLPKPNGEIKTVLDAIGHLSNVRTGISATHDPEHVSLPLTERNLRRIQQSRPGGTWNDWDDKDVNACHRKSYYPASYGRMSWDRPAPTITTQFCYYSTGRFGHPEQDRTITIREAALLQTFPEHYTFFNKSQPLPIAKIAKHIGNAVPVELARAIGNTIMEVAGAPK